MSLRELLLAAIVLGCCVAAFFRPRWGLYGYVWFALMRPDMLVWAPASRPYSLALAATTLAGSLRYFGRVPLLMRNPFSRWLIILLLVTMASAVFAVRPELAWDPFELYLRIIIMALLIPVLVQTPNQFRTFLLVMGGSLGLLGAKFGVYGLLSGGVRYASGYGGMMSDNNTLALALAIGVALCWHLKSAVPSGWLSLAFVGMTVTGIAAVMMTFSRGAALSVIVCALLMILRSQRKLLTLVGMTVVGIPLVLLMGQSYSDRLATMKVPEQESSAQSRLENYSAALKLWKDYPLLGVGFGEDNERHLLSKYTNRDVAADGDLVIHDTYLQVLVDSGIVAALIFCSLLIASIIWLGSARQRLLAEKAGIGPCVYATQLALVAFLTGATFLSREAFDLVYMLLMSAAAWWQIQQTDGGAEPQLASFTLDPPATVPSQ